MEDIEFESNIREAFKRLNRAKLKTKMNEIDGNITSEKLAFEDNIAEAGRRIQRDKMKAILQNSEVESKKSTAPFIYERQGENGHAANYSMESAAPRMSQANKNSWWKYAAAACLVLGLGIVLILQLPDTNYSPVLSKKEVKKEVIIKDDVTTKKSNIPVDETTKRPIHKIDPKIEIQDFSLVIKSENLGFSSTDKLNVQVRIDKKKGNGTVYSYIDNKLTLVSSEVLKVQSTISFHNNLYVKVSNDFYLIEPSKEFQPLVVLSNNMLIQKLDKIEFTN